MNLEALWIEGGEAFKTTIMEEGHIIQIENGKAIHCFLLLLSLRLGSKWPGPGGNREHRSSSPLRTCSRI